MNEIKLSNMNLPGAVNTAEKGKSAASAPPPTTDAQQGKGTEAAKEVAQVQSLAEAKAAESAKQQPN